MIRKNPFSLNDKNILVTGASSGIGRSVAVECSRVGARMVLTGRSADRLIETLSMLDGENHTYLAADLCDTEQLKSLIDLLPPLDGVCLCAGVNRNVPVSFLTRKKLNEMFDTNFFSQVELTRLILKKKLLRNHASIVGISSIGGNYVFTPAASGYGASKAALRSWIKSAAKELAPKYRINCICPGHTDTPMNRNGDISEGQLETYMETIPMKQFGEPEDTAYGAVYLLSDASRWITGTSLVIDGGASL